MPPAALLGRRMRSEPEAALGAICVFWAVLQVCVLVYVVGERDGFLFPLAVFNIWGVVLGIRGLKPLIRFLREGANGIQVRGTAIAPIRPTLNQPKKDRFPQLGTV